MAINELQAIVFVIKIQKVIIVKSKDDVTPG